MPAGDSLSRKCLATAKVNLRSSTALLTANGWRPSSCKTRAVRCRGEGKKSSVVVQYGGARTTQAPRNLRYGVTQARAGRILGRNWNDHHEPGVCQVADTVMSDLRGAKTLP